MNFSVAESLRNPKWDLCHNNYTLGHYEFRKSVNLEISIDGSFESQVNYNNNALTQIKLPQKLWQFRCHRFDKKPLGGLYLQIIALQKKIDVGSLWFQCNKQRNQGEFDSEGVDGAANSKKGSGWSQHFLRTARRDGREKLD